MKGQLFDLVFFTQVLAILDPTDDSEGWGQGLMGYRWNSLKFAIN